MYAFKKVPFVRKKPPHFTFIYYIISFLLNNLTQWKNYEFTGQNVGEVKMMWR